MVSYTIQTFSLLVYWWSAHRIIESTQGDHVDVYEPTESTVSDAEDQRLSSMERAMERAARTGSHSMHAPQGPGCGGFLRHWCCPPAKARLTARYQPSMAGDAAVSHSYMDVRLDLCLRGCEQEVWSCRGAARGCSSNRAKLLP